MAVQGGPVKYLVSRRGERPGDYYDEYEIEASDQRLAAERYTLTVFEKSTHTKAVVRVVPKVQPRIPVAPVYVTLTHPWRADAISSEEPR